MNTLNLKEMEMIEGGGANNRYILFACGFIISTMELSMVNPVWAAVHLSAGAGCMMYTGMSLFH